MISVEKMEEICGEVAKNQHFGKNVEAMTLLQSISEDVVPHDCLFFYFYNRFQLEYKIKGEKTSFVFAEKAIKVAANDDQRSAVYSYLATYAIQKNDFPLAQDYATQCLKYAMVDGSKAAAYKIQGRLDAIKKDYDKALENQNLAAMYAERSHDDRFLCYIIMEIADSWYEKGFLSTALMEVDRAEEYANLCHELPLVNRCAIRKAQILYQLNRDADARKVILNIPKQLD